MGNFEDVYNSVIKESPDNFDIVKPNGEHVNVKYSEDDSAITFTLYEGHGFYGSAKYDDAFHGIFVMLMLGHEHPDDYPRIKYWNGFPPMHVRRKVKKIHDSAKDFYSKDRAIDGNMLAGRIFPKYKVISFWNKTDELVRDAKMFKAFTEDIGIDMSEYQYDLIDRKGLIPWGKPKEDTPKDEKLSQAEIDELMKVQHLDPNAKKMLRKNAGYQKSKLPFGWNVFSRMSDSVEKDGVVINENDDPPVIVLKGKKINEDSPNIRLLKDFQGSSDPNPLNASNRVMGGVVVELVPIPAEPHQILMKYIHSLDKKKGNATRAVKNVMFLADKHDVDIRVFPKPLDDSISQEDLEEFYFKLGFRYSNKEGEMIYEPEMD